MKLKVKELTQENYGKFGTVIEKPKYAPTYVADGVKCWHHISKLEIPGDTYAGLLELQKSEMVFSAIERHFRSHEIFCPNEGNGIAIFAPAGDLDLSRIEAFYIDGTKAYTIDIGTWHCPPIPISDYMRLTLIFPYDIPEDAELVKIPDITVEL